VKYSLTDNYFLKIYDIIFNRLFKGDNMFLDPRKYLLTIKEKDVHVKGKDVRDDLFQIILLNYNDIKTLSETTKQELKNKDVEAAIAQMVILIKSFDMEVTYLCYWSYDDLNKKITKLLAEDGSLDEYFNLYQACKKTAVENNIILDSDEFLNLFAVKIKEKFIIDISNYKKKK